jgi:hypothetical protein
MTMITGITTRADYPPIPTANYNWSAQFSFHDGDDELYGHGPTEDAAVLDLLVNGGEFEDDGSVLEAIVDLAFKAWMNREGIPS